MKKSILFITSFFLCVFCLKSNAQQSRPEVTWENMEGVTVPIPPQVHPRLYVRSADLPDLKKRMEHPHVKEVLATLNKLGKDRTPEEEAKVKDRGFRYYFEMRGVTSRVQVQALDYLVYGDKKQARSAITAMPDSIHQCIWKIQPFLHLELHGNQSSGLFKNRCSQSRVHIVKPWPALCVQSAELNDKNMQQLLQQHGKQQIGSCSDKERGNPCLKLHPSCNEQSNRYPHREDNGADNSRYRQT